jgi:hypothetical protein
LTNQNGFPVRDESFVERGDEHVFAGQQFSQVIHLVGFDYLLLDGAEPDLKMSLTIKTAI